MRDFALIFGLLVTTEFVFVCVAQVPTRTANMHCLATEQMAAVFVLLLAMSFLKEHWVQRVVQSRLVSTGLC